MHLAYVLRLTVGSTEPPLFFQHRLCQIVYLETDLGLGPEGARGAPDGVQSRDEESLPLCSHLFAPKAFGVFLAK